MGRLRGEIPPTQIGAKEDISYPIYVDSSMVYANIFSIAVGEVHLFAETLRWAMF